MSTVYLIRHGQASFGAKDYDILSETGIAQARIIGKSMAERGILFDALYHGSLKRQIQTAKETMAVYAEKELFLPEPVLCEAFDEYDGFAVWRHHLPGVLEEFPHLKKEQENFKTDTKSFQILFQHVTDRWISGEFDSAGCPAWADFKKRVKDGFKSMIRSQGSGRNIAVFTSGGTISVIMQMALGLSDQKTMDISWQIMNASITRIRYREDQISLSAFNEISHLEMTRMPEMLTFR
ncbi:MAG: histidine phosphatase family protein [Desulfococcaceae bacterium]